MGGVISMKTRKVLYTGSFTKGEYLKWCPDETSGYPIQVTGTDATRKTFSYIALNSEDLTEHHCPMNDPHLKAMEKTEVTSYVTRQLLVLEPQQTYWEHICESFTNLCRRLRNHHKEKRSYRRYQAHLKRLKLI